MKALTRRDSAAYKLIHSYSLKLVVLAIVLFTVPAVLYWQFREAEIEQSKVLHDAVAQTGRLVAALLRPHFEQFHSELPENLGALLTDTAVSGSNIKLLLRPANGGDKDFYYIASSPPVSDAYLEQERRQLIASGVFRNLAPTCDKSSDLSVKFTNPVGKPELITSMTPIHIGDNCWVVITSKSATPPARGFFVSSFSQTNAIRIAAIIYVLSSILVISLFGHMWRNVSRFRSAARRIRLRRGGKLSFWELNSIPELDGVARDFDSLVTALVESEQYIRQTAEENSHAIKAPLAVISQSVEPLRRALNPNDGHAQRSLQLIERSVSRLDVLVSSVRDTDSAAAEVLYPETQLIDVSQFLNRLLASYEITLAAEGKHLKSNIVSNVRAYANEDLMEAVIENVLENAASFTPPNGVIDVLLQNDGDWARICVADSGPGATPMALSNIFDRYYSDRPLSNDNHHSPRGVNGHQGLGLWIVKRNVEGLGGTVIAQNRANGGFEVIISLRKLL